jgi:hypothetical protein
LFIYETVVFCFDGVVLRGFGGSANDYIVSNAQSGGYIAVFQCFAHRFAQQL